MFLGKRHWAERAVRESGIPEDARVFVEVADMLLLGAEQCQRGLGADPLGRHADDLTLVMMSARVMPDNASAVERLMRKFDLSNDRAARLLDLVRQAAMRMYASEGRETPPA